MGFSNGPGITQKISAIGAVFAMMAYFGEGLGAVLTTNVPAVGDAIGSIAVLAGVGVMVPLAGGKLLTFAEGWA